MKQNLPINPDILKWARETLCIPVEEVARRLNKAPEIIKQWEEGIGSPTYIQLETLAYKIFKRPIAIFFFPSPPEEKKPESSFRTFPKSLIHELSPSFFFIYRQAEAMQINLNELSNGTNPAPRRIFDDLDFSLNERASSMVRKVRDYLRITLDDQMGWRNADVAFRTWRKSFEECGIFVFKEAFKQEDISGFCLFDKVFPIIYVNNSMPMTRQIFTLFHELAHILFKIGGIDIRQEDFIGRLRGDNRKIEVLCNRLTADFLVPHEDFKRRISSIKVQDQEIQNLARLYKVSREVILRKVLDMGLINQVVYEEKSKQWTEEARKWRSRGKGGNYYSTKASYLGDSYLKLTFQKYYQHKINENQLADYLGIKVNSIPGIELATMRKG